MIPWLDASLYPETDPPKALNALEDQIDWIARLCSAWDHGIMPYKEAIEEIRRNRWLEAVDQCRLLTSPAYHLLRSWHGLPPLPFLGDTPRFLLADAELQHV
jgi:hypothetical protein